MSTSRSTRRPGVDLELHARRGLLFVTAAAALTGVLAGLARLGVPVGWGPAHALEHGPLMVVGVFGTVIGLERAVALARGWGYAAPAAGAACAIAQMSGVPWAPWLATAACVALTAVNVAIVRKQAEPFTWLMLAGSGILALGTLAWALGRPVFELVPTWLAFFVLTIVAERLELSRLTPTPRWASRALVAIASVFGGAACARLAGVEAALPVLGISAAALGVWQLRFDLARRTVRQPGLPRFSASNVLLGAAWLIVFGALLLAHGLPPAGPAYDASLHAVFIGYVLSMVVAHAPIILPAVARTEIPFHPALWAAPALLHGGLVTRIAGDLTGDVGARQLGATASALALASFAVAVVAARLYRQPAPKRRSA